jgi:hypothetical protein
MRLKGQNFNDIHFISALVQDSITMFDWVNFQNKEFEMFINRFCWELKAEKHDELYRKNAVLTIKNVSGVMVKNPPSERNEFKTLLACLSESSSKISLIFDNDFEILIKGRKLVLELHDISEQWPTGVIPIHIL